MEQAERRSIFQFSDIGFAVAIIAMIIVMIVPLPFFLLDLLLTLNISLAVVILLVSIYTKEALDFSSFPSLLLIATLFRLSLNVASTRLILLRGNAFNGKVIQAFGNFVVGGDYVVGIIVFCILVIIQFVVITKGAQRIAEVAARFTLDAMPGKQMAIDADLNAGLIDEKEAMRRRERITQEADFYGAMDGASKFVRGDAIAGIIITLINILGGFVIGVWKGGLSIQDAAQVYTRLTVGDGLVTQIPALLISTAAGIIVSRAASDKNMGVEVALQLFSTPRAIFIAMGLMVFFAFIPGLPTVPFLLLAALMGYIGSAALRRQQPAVESAAVQGAKADEEEKHVSPSEAIKEGYENVITTDMLELSMGYALIPLADENRGGEILARITALRRSLLEEMGLMLSPIRVRDDMLLGAEEYSIRLKGVEVARGRVKPGYVLAMNPGTAEGSLSGEQIKEPAFGLPAVWIQPSESAHAERMGYTVVDATTVIITHLSEVIHTYSHELLTRQVVKDMLDALKKKAPALVEDIVPSVISISELQKVLQNLLKERVPIKDMQTIMETLANYAPKIKDADVLTEYVRFSLGRVITSLNVSEDGKLYCVTFSPQLEERLKQFIHRGEMDSFLALPPEEANRMVKKISDEIERHSKMGRNVVVLCSPQLRMYVKRFLERYIPYISVLSYNEIVGKVEVEPVNIVEKM